MSGKSVLAWTGVGLGAVVVLVAAGAYAENEIVTNTTAESYCPPKHASTGLGDLVHTPECNQWPHNQPRYYGNGSGGWWTTKQYYSYLEYLEQQKTQNSPASSAGKRQAPVPTPTQVPTTQPQQQNSSGLYCGGPGVVTPEDGTDLAAMGYPPICWGGKVQVYNAQKGRYQILNFASPQFLQYLDMIREELQDTEWGAYLSHLTNEEIIAALPYTIEWLENQRDQERELAIAWPERLTIEEGLKPTIRHDEEPTTNEFTFPETKQTSWLEPGEWKQTEGYFSKAA